MRISEALLLSEEALRLHLKEYQFSRKLKTENGGSKEKLSFEQSQALKEHLGNHTYLYTKDIVAYVKSTFRVIYSISGMCYWLKRNQFSYKKPSLVPGKADKEIQEAWIAAYNKQKHELKEDETICFMDGVHPTHNTQLSYGWIRKGVRKEIRSNTGRQRLNISGAVDLIGKKLHFQQDHKVRNMGMLQIVQLFQINLIHKPFELFKGTRETQIIFRRVWFRFQNGMIHCLKS